MWKLAVGLLFVLIWAPPQAYQEHLLRQARHIVGVVVDSEGRPVAEARIDHSNDSGQVHETDSDGRFVLDTKAPALVVRKVGFHSKLIRTENVAETRVVLRRLTQNRALPPLREGSTVPRNHRVGISASVPQNSGREGERTGPRYRLRYPVLHGQDQRGTKSNQAGQRTILELRNPLGHGRVADNQA